MPDFYCFIFIVTCLGICIDLSQMNELEEVHVDDMDCVVQAGMTWNNLNHGNEAETAKIKVQLSVHKPVA